MSTVHDNRDTWEKGPVAEITVAVRPFPGLQALCGEQVLLRPLPPPKQSHGLWVPDTAERNKQGHEAALNGRISEGIVAACGPGMVDESGRLVPLDVVPGDHVRFYFMAEYFLRWPTDDYLIVPASYIQAVFTPEGIAPLGDRVLVRRLEAAPEGQSRIIAPEIAKKVSVRGSVLAVGNGAQAPMTVELGQTVVFKATSGTAVEWDREDLLILKESEILLILED